MLNVTRLTSLVTGLCILVAMAGAQSPKRVRLASAYGKGESTFADALGIKLQQQVEEVPDMVPGKSYSDPEREALPKIKSYTWSGKVPNLGTVSLGRNERMKYVTFSSFAFDSPAVKTVPLALDRLGLPSAGVHAGKDRSGGYGFTVKLGGLTWQANFHPKNPDVGNKPFLSISDPA
jgi:hypothetical protein